MTDRVQKLRQQSIDAVNRMSSERAILVTQYYKSARATEVSVPVRRAECFSHILRNKYIYIGDGELIVGERGEAPKATPTYPEVCLHTKEDFDIFGSRDKVWFTSDQKIYKDYEESVIPFWKGKSNREKIFNSVSQQWIDAYEAGVFTEFQEQRAPGHTSLGDKIFHKGMSDIINDARESLKKHKEDVHRREELNAIIIACEAIITYAKRHADKLTTLATTESDTLRKKELLKMAEVCSNVPQHAPKTLHEALQYYWFVHLGVITEVNPWDSFNPGRLDQHLYPFYKNDIDSGRLTKEQAEEILCCFWIKFNNHPAPAKVGITAQESNTYTDFCNINLGGMKADGSDGVNEMTFLLLDVIEKMRLLQPSSNIQVSEKNPDAFIDRTVKILKTGFGQPSIFNADVITKELMRQGKSIVDARQGGASGCVESGAFGKEAYILTGYFNIPKVLEITLNNGTDPRTGKNIGIKTGEIESFDTMDKLLSAFEKQLNHFVDIKAEGNNIIEQIFMDNIPVPFLSAVIDDCVAEGKDYMCGGARYNSTYIQGVGMGSITDSLAAIYKKVYDTKELTLSEFKNILDKNFAGHEQLRYELVCETPKWGNDDEYADQFARKVFEIYFNAVDSRPTPRGSLTRVNLLPTTCHVYFGSVIGASPDGRKAGETLSEGISPVQGADTKGPTAVIKSAAKLDHVRTGGTLLNQKFTPSFFDAEGAINKVTKLVRSYFCMGGHHIQFNVVSADTLRDAQKHPEKYRDLIVRVAGYSDYFNDLGDALQNEIITRTEHNLV